MYRKYFCYGPFNAKIYRACTNTLESNRYMIWSTNNSQIWFEKIMYIWVDQIGQRLLSQILERNRHHTWLPTVYSHFRFCFVSLHFWIWNTVIWRFLDKLGKSGLISCETRMDRHYLGCFLFHSLLAPLDDQWPDLFFLEIFDKLVQNLVATLKSKKKNWVKINNCLENAPGSSE